MGSLNGKLSPTTMQELINNTAFTEQEINEWYAGFKRDSPNGTVNLEEFKRIYGDLFPKGDPTLFAEHAFRTFDASGDGLIDFREFITALHVSTRGTEDQKLTWAFNMYDMDNDGQVTKVEMLEIMNAMHRMMGRQPLTANGRNTTPGQLVDHIFNKFDKNGDQCITREEFVKGAKEDKSIMQLLQIDQLQNQKK